MPTDLESHRSRVFHALADTTRRQILQRIAEQDRTVGELKEPFAISGPAISKHLRVLEEAQLIERQKDGRQHRFALKTAPLQDAQRAIEHLARFWTSRLDQLDAFLRTQTDSTQQPNSDHA